MDENVFAWVAAFSYPGVLLLLLLAGVGAPVSEEFILLAGGVMAARGAATFPLMVFVAYVGVILGDSLLFHLGREFGPKLKAWHVFRKWLHPKRVEQASKTFRSYGAWTVLTARFLPGTRAPTFLLAGMLKLPARNFFLADALGALVTAPGMTYLGYRYGPWLIAPLRKVGASTLAVLAMLLFIVGGIRWLQRRAVSKM